MEAQLDAIAQRALEHTLAPSLSIAATKNAELAYAKAFGDAATQSVYNIASVTKQFTAALVMLLVRENALTLDDAVAEWFPHFTRARDITIRHLLSHTSGYPDYYPLGFPDEEKFHETPPREIVERYATRELQFEPGSAYSYSNTGYHIVGLIIERVTGRPFGRVLIDLILRPAGMASSFFNDPPTVTPMHVRGFTRFCLGPQRASDGERAGWTYSSGGIASTASDLARWHVALMNGTILTPREITEVTTPFTLIDGSAAPTALGWFVEKRGPHDVVQHSGGIGGFSSQVVVSLRRQCSVVVLANGDHVPTGAIASQLFEAILPEASPPVAAVVDDAAHAESLTRTWIERFRDAAVDRTKLEPQFNGYVTPERADDAREGLTRAGQVQNVKAILKGERGGMPWYRTRVTFTDRLADVVFREAPHERLAEFNVYPMP